jgi:hypothetical protein
MVKDADDDAMVEERPTPLAPQKSAVGKILRKRINQNWKEEHRMRMQRQRENGGVERGVDFLSLR